MFTIGVNLMLTKLKLFLCGLALTACVATPKPAPPLATTAPHPAPGEFEEEQQFSLAANGTLRIKFNPNYLPANAATLEIVYKGKYLGFYEVSDLIYLPKYPDQRVSLVATFSDIEGKILVTKTYYIKI